MQNSRCYPRAEDIRVSPCFRRNQVRLPRLTDTLRGLYTRIRAFPVPLRCHRGKEETSRGRVPFFRGRFPLLTISNSEKRQEKR